MKTCVNCGFELTERSKKYCDNSCQGAYEAKQKVEAWKNGHITGLNGRSKVTAPWLRRYLKKTRGSACSKCGWDEHHPSDGKSLTEINHIDGNVDNNVESNLEILCPNCHSMTVNFRNRNKSSTRLR